MIFEFKTSGKTVDIDNEDNFDKLKGDELSELLYEDPNYIRWMTSKHIKKFSGSEIGLTLLKNPDLFDYFAINIGKVSEANLVKLAKEHPSLLEKIKYVNVGAYILATHETELTLAVVN